MTNECVLILTSYIAAAVARSTRTCWYL